jgi:hypothetical protein
MRCMALGGWGERRRRSLWAKAITRDSVFRYKG